MPEPIVLVWIGTIVTLLLVLLILLEIHRNNQKREHEEMFGSDEFMKKSSRFRLTEKEFEEMRELAEQEGRTVSNLLRYLVAKERKEREK